MASTGTDWRMVRDVRLIGNVRLSSSLPTPVGNDPVKHVSGDHAGIGMPEHLKGSGKLFPLTHIGDVVAFGGSGVWVALARGNGTFQDARLVLANLGVEQGWQVDKHPRFVADVTGDGKGDLVECDIRPS